MLLVKHFENLHLWQETDSEGLSPRCCSNICKTGCCHLCIFPEEAIRGSIYCWLWIKMDDVSPLLPTAHKNKPPRKIPLVLLLPSCSVIIICSHILLGRDHVCLLLFLLHFMSHLLTWRRWGLWPATRGGSRCFGFTHRSRHVVHL